MTHNPKTLRKLILILSLSIGMAIGLLRHKGQSTNSGSGAGDTSDVPRQRQHTKLSPGQPEKLRVTSDESTTIDNVDDAKGAAESGSDGKARREAQKGIEPGTTRESQAQEIETPHPEPAEALLDRVEKASVPKQDYTVVMKTKVFKRGADGETQLVQESESDLIYSPEEGLRADTKSSGRVVMTVDVARLLKKMRGPNRGQFKWIIENEDSTIDDQETTVLSASGETWLVRLWVREKDGVILRYDQHLKGQHVASAYYDYPTNALAPYLPTKTTTKFHQAGRTFVQTYNNYTYHNDGEQP